MAEAELASIRVTAAEAEDTALSHRGMGYGPNDAKVIWKKAGCVFLGKYTAPRMPTHDQPYVPVVFAAYLVQVLADPVPAFPIDNGVMVIDAVTGKVDSEYGGGFPPFGIMGTTCGVAP